MTGVNNVSLKCLVEERPRDSCITELQWLFFDKPLKSGEKYEIQERKTKTKCNVLMITIFNITAITSCTVLATKKITQYPAEIAE